MSPRDDWDVRMCFFCHADGDNTPVPVSSLKAEYQDQVEDALASMDQNAESPPSSQGFASTYVRGYGVEEEDIPTRPSNPPPREDSLEYSLELEHPDAWYGLRVWMCPKHLAECLSN